MNDTRKGSLKMTLNRLNHITEGCRDDMHESDEQGLKASFITIEHGFQQQLIILKRDGHQEMFNLAALIALARRAKL